MHSLFLSSGKMRSFCRWKRLTALLVRSMKVEDESQRLRRQPVHGNGAAPLETTACAETVLRHTMETFFAPPKTPEELQDLIKEGVEIEPLRLFSEAARAELHALTVW